MFLNAKMSNLSATSCSVGPSFLGTLKLELLWDPFTPTNNSATPNKDQGHYYWGGVLDNGPYSEHLSAINVVWVTAVIFFNGVVPWQIFTLFCQI